MLFNRSPQVQHFGRSLVQKLLSIAVNKDTTCHRHLILGNHIQVLRNQIIPLAF